MTFCISMPFASSLLCVLAYLACAAKPTSVLAPLQRPRRRTRRLHAPGPFSAEIEPSHCVLPSACVHVGRARGSLCEFKLAWAIDGSMFGYMHNAIAGPQTAWSLTGSGAKGQVGRNLVPLRRPIPRVLGHAVRQPQRRAAAVYGSVRVLTRQERSCAVSKKRRVNRRLE